MTIQDFKEFDLSELITVDEYNHHRNMSYDEFVHKTTLDMWFYWEKVLVIENVVELTNK